MKNRKSTNKKLLDNTSLEIKILTKYRAHQIFSKNIGNTENTRRIEALLKVDSIY